LLVVIGIEPILRYKLKVMDIGNLRPDGDGMKGGRRKY